MTSKEDTNDGANRSLPTNFRTIELSLPGSKHPLRARAVWMQRKGLGYEVGFAFDAMSDDQRELLASVARTAIDTEFMGLKSVSDAA